MQTLLHNSGMYARECENHTHDSVRLVIRCAEAAAPKRCIRVQTWNEQQPRSCAFIRLDLHKLAL
jgi:hypothetical protein